MQLTWDLGMDHVRSWVLSGDYELDDSFDRPFVWSSTIVTGLSEAAIVPQPDDASAHSRAGADTETLAPTELTPASSTLASSLAPSNFPSIVREQQLLAVPDHIDDPLIPKQRDVRRIFHDGQHTWQHFLSQALALPRGVFPTGLDPSIMLQDMPPLPDSVPPKGVLAGAPTWIVPDPEPPAQPPSRGRPDLNLNHVTGTTKYFRLAYPGPINCIISSDPSACHYGNPSGTSDASNAPQGLAILTMCWSYIFSTRLLHLQDRKAHFTDSYIRPLPINVVGELAQDEILVQLPREASLRLVHWLCAILAPKPAWAADDEGGAFSPWDARCTGDARFVIATEEQVSIDPSAQPPKPTEATELLIEFCNLFGIGHEPRRSRDPRPLSPIKAAFLATLAIPFYRMAKLQPHLPRPSLKPQKAISLDEDEAGDVRRYTGEVHYYMPLSMHPYALGPVLWSIFWQPDIQCNLVSPWLAAITSVIRPAFNYCDFEMLAKIFTLRRPRVALWWHGLFLLGNPKILDFIRNYLTNLDEGCTYDTLSRPDIVTAAWTGAPQSYQDDLSSTAYYDLDDDVPRAALLQHRHTLTLRDPWPLFYGWRPFGFVPKDTIEPDLYPWLERGHDREYRHWTWWSKNDASFEPYLYAGYRKETGRFIPNVPDNLALLPAPDSFAPLPPAAVVPIDFEPSRRATLQMINHSLGNIIGERSVSTAVIPDLEQSHPWLKDWTPV
ncbi:hypothetical protein FALBO_3565 [Fusarium albosuccineum]|uniref:Uncharacterized protein n=1 Tax=Fusarium albosuccineum TaxID=1237068 RepID=A0A8H4LJI7_9HYPO|nr:hypothetical protein FALBO_3565 [Fusarium albosuccineum]